jgi:MarR family transcriptional regulator, transcriptional regulator for hemolysin
VGAVLLRLERREGLNQSDLAEDLDIQPITLTRLVDRLCLNGLIERRADPNDRRAKLLYLTPAARPLIERISEQVEVLADQVLDGIDPKAIDAVRKELSLARDKSPKGHCGEGPAGSEALWLSQL